MQHSEIIGWGADASFDARPGVPAAHAPRPIVDARPDRLQQVIGRPSVWSPHRPITPVYGTAIPPRGLSGLIRRLAYRAPDYKARRYVLLTIADQVDVIEHNPLPMMVFAGALALGVLGVRALVRR